MKIRAEQVLRRAKRRPVVRSTDPGNPLRSDPSRTAGLRRRFGASISRQFAQLRLDVYRLVGEEDAFGLSAPQNPLGNESPTDNTRWRFQPDPEKVKAFADWLRAQMARTVRGKSEEQLWQAYVEEGFRKGAGRAFDDTRARERIRRSAMENLPFYEGTREEFLRSSFAQPVAVEKVRLLAGRAFDDLEGITNDMSLRMTRALTDGLVQGQGPREIARTLANEVDLGRDRALKIARTEIIRAHAEGQLVALEGLGVEEVGVAVEWSTSGLGRTKKGNPSPCKACAPLKGVVLRVEDAHGLIPRHPNCLCAFVPANVGEDPAGQKRSKAIIRSAIKESVREGGARGWPGAELTPRDAPESQVGNARGRSGANCGTGAGGFKPGNICAKGGGSGASLPPAFQKALRSRDLSESQRQEYGEAVQKALSKMPDKAKKRFFSNVRRVTFYSGTDALTDSLIERYPRDPDIQGLRPAGRMAGGVYHRDSKELGLDGRHENQSAREVYGHEFGHGLDGPDNSYSSSERWQEAWRKDIVAGGKPRLTAYASSEPAEGFAEFARLVYGRDYPRKLLQEKYPSCAKFWTEEGLW